MHVSPAKHSYAWLPRKCDYRSDTRMDGRTDAGQGDPCVPLRFAGDTKRDLTQSYDKNPYRTNKNFENQWTTHKRHQKLQIHNDCGPTTDGQLE